MVDYFTFKNSFPKHTPGRVFFQDLAYEVYDENRLPLRQNI
jgi:hypothetical protein